MAVTEEEDTISRWEKSKFGIYQINIKRPNGFSEIEIGTLVSWKMQTATANVTDGNYPVLEEYTFESDADCNADKYIKTVLNPTSDNFKTCFTIFTK